MRVSALDLSTYIGSCTWSSAVVERAAASDEAADQLDQLEWRLSVGSADGAARATDVRARESIGRVQANLMTPKLRVLKSTQEYSGTQLLGGYYSTKP